MTTFISMRPRTEDYGDSTPIHNRLAKSIGPSMPRCIAWIRRGFRVPRIFQNAKSIHLCDECLFVGPCDADMWIEMAITNILGKKYRIISFDEALRIGDGKR